MHPSASPFILPRCENETAMSFKSLAPTDEAVERHARKCVALAQAARAWESAVERARILRGRGLPKSVEARNAQPRRKPSRNAIVPLAREGGQPKHYENPAQ